MNKEIISDRQGICIITLFLMGTTLIIGGAGEAKRDVWLAIIIAILGGLLIALLYARLLSLFPGKDLIEIIQIALGKFFGKLVGILYLWYAFHLGALVIRNFGEFIDIVALPETPMIVPMIVMSLLCAWVAKEGVEVLGRLAEIFILILFTVILVEQLLVIPQLDFKNIQPVFYNGIGPILKGAFSAITFPFAETVIFTIIFSCLKKKKSPYRTYTLGIIIGGIIILIISVRNVLVLGSGVIEHLYFPSYIAVTRVNIANFIQRLEIAVSLVFLVSAFIKLSVCLLAVTRGTARLLNLKDYRFTVFPITFLMLNTSYILYENTMEMVEWAFKVYPYYALPFQVILPIIILIAAQIKKRKLKN